MKHKLKQNTHPKNQHTSLIILAGGQGLRMGGINKGLMSFQGEAMIDLILTQVRPFFEDIIVITNNQSEAYQARPDIRIAADTQPGFCGPLAGIATGLSLAKNPYSFILPCDAPGPFSELHHQLLNHLSSTTKLIIPDDGHRLQPLFSLIHRDLLPALEQALTLQHYAVTRFFKDQNPTIIQVANLSTHFKNLNSPEDLIQ